MKRCNRYETKLGLTGSSFGGSSDCASLLFCSMLARRLVSSNVPRLVTRNPTCHARWVAPFRLSGNKATDVTFIEKLKGDPKEKPPALPSASHIITSTVTAFSSLGCLSILHCYAPPSLELATLLIPSFGSTIITIFGYPSIPFAQPRHVIGGHVISAAAGEPHSLTGFAIDSRLRHVVGYVVGEAIMWSGLAGTGALALAAPASVSLALLGMMLTKTMHPPVSLRHESHTRTRTHCIDRRALLHGDLQAGGTAMIAAGLGSGSAGVGSVGALFILTRACSEIALQVPSNTLHETPLRAAVLSGSIAIVAIAAIVNNLSRSRRYPAYWL